MAKKKKSKHISTYNRKQKFLLLTLFIALVSLALGIVLVSRNQIIFSDAAVKRSGPFPVDPCTGYLTQKSCEYDKGLRRCYFRQTIDGCSGLDENTCLSVNGCVPGYKTGFKFYKCGGTPTVCFRKSNQGSTPTPTVFRNQQPGATIVPGM